MILEARKTSLLVTRVLLKLIYNICNNERLKGTPLRPGRVTHFKRFFYKTYMF